uniref:Uncharacterized protein n=1 Tax=viral metagenome TaxID=1070528 RepID=A0A6M3M6Y4_9ZZZZ
MMMKKIGGSTEFVQTAEGYVQKPFAMYECKESHLLKVFSGFNDIVFSRWEDAPAKLDLGCGYCNMITQGEEDL